MNARFQERVRTWFLKCFDEKKLKNKKLRAIRFGEEAIELLQACDLSEDQVRALVTYVYGRPKGELIQEVGGVATTFAMLCEGHDLDLNTAAEMELERISAYSVIEKIRAKEAAKPSMELS